MALAIGLALCGSQSASAAALPVPLGSAGAFAVLGYSTVTNIGPSVIAGDIGLSPGTAVVGFPPGIHSAGAIYAADAVALQARNAASNAFTTASGQTGPTTVGVELGNTTLSPGLYESGGVLQVNGTLTLDGGGDPAAMFVFRSASTLITGSASRVSLTNGANLCNVFWIVPSSATLGTATSFVGTIIATASITANTGSSVRGRLLALNGAVTLDSTSVTSTGCSGVTGGSGSGSGDGGSLETEAAGASGVLAATGVDLRVEAPVAFAAGVGGLLILLAGRRRSPATRRADAGSSLRTMT
jgi:hypothetical protein